jgi:L,D-peptidoglycan transpeptidase YkuD (ErfK/YbiS/YcfS/YnhG family)
VGRLIEVRVGARGLGRGRGLHGAETSLAAALAAMPPKREGDRRSPAGVFGFGVAFGQSARRPHAPGSWPWRRVDSRDRFVDDPASVYYNSWQRTPAAGARTLAWRSAEELAQYSLGIVVEHNMGPVARGAGSAIFIHAASSLRAPSIGCTLLAERELVEVLRWLSPAARPVLVQLPGTIFD